MPPPKRRATAAPRGGVDLGGTKIQAVIVDPRHAVLGQARRPTPTCGGPADVTAAIAETLREAAAAAGLRTSDLVRVGVGSPGAIDARAGTVASASNLPGWASTTYPLAATLAAELGTVIALGNDVQVATDAEAQLGAGREYRSMLGVFWGTGVGGGIVLRDRARLHPDARRPTVPVRALGVHGGLCRPRCAGAPRARAARRRRRDRPLQDRPQARP